MRPGNVDNFSDTKALGGKAVQQTYPNREVGISNIYSLVLEKQESLVDLAGKLDYNYRLRIETGKSCQKRQRPAGKAGTDAGGLQDRSADSEYQKRRSGNHEEND